MTAPICFVEVTPPPGSPAYTAGLQAGDAILSFGSATTFAELPSQIREHVTVRLQVMDLSGRVQKRVLTPRVFDASRPKSLLGCQIIDTCPAHFQPHPALRPAELPTPPADAAAGDEGASGSIATAGSFATLQAAAPGHESCPAGVAVTCTSQARSVSGRSVSGMSSIFNAPRADVEMAARLRKQPPNWHEEELYRADAADAYSEDADSVAGSNDYGEACSQTQLSLAGTAVADRITDALLRDPNRTALARCAPGLPCRALACAGPQSRRGAQRLPPRVGGRGKEADGATTSLFATCGSRCLLLLASALNLAHGCFFLAAPAFGSQMSSVLDAFQRDLWDLVTMHCEGGGASGAQAPSQQQWAETSSKPTGLTLELFARTALLVACIQLVLTATGCFLALTPRALVRPALGGYEPERNGMYGSARALPARRCALRACALSLRSRRKSGCPSSASP